MQSDHYDVDMVQNATETNIVARAWQEAGCMDSIVSDNIRHERESARPMEVCAPVIVPQLRPKREYTRRLPKLPKVKSANITTCEPLPWSQMPAAMMGQRREPVRHHPGPARRERGPAAAQYEMQSQMYMPASQYGAAMDIGQWVQPVESGGWYNQAPQYEGYGHMSYDMAGMYYGYPPVVQDQGPRLNPLLAPYIRDPTPVQCVPQASVVNPSQPRFTDLRPSTSRAPMPQAVQQPAMMGYNCQYHMGPGGHVSTESAANYAMAHGHGHAHTEAMVNPDLHNSHVFSVHNPRW